MPRVANKSSRIYHFNNGMCGPGQEAELGDDEVSTKYMRTLLESGELVEVGRQAAPEQKPAPAQAPAAQAPTPAPQAAATAEAPAAKK